MSRNKLAVFLAFLSGVSALMYQIIWIRKFSLIFGVHVFSITTVLATFMAGLAIGSYLFGKWADRVKNPLGIFLMVEVIIGLYGISFPQILDFISVVYGNMNFGSSNTYVISHLIRFLLAFGILIIPTICMGGIIPILSKIAVKRIHSLGGIVSMLYGLNNLGAFAGSFLTGFVLIKFLGLQYGLFLAAALNGVNAILALLMYNSKPSITKLTIQNNTTSKHEAIKGNNKLIRIALIIFAVEGFTTLAYEIIWTRLLQEYSYEKTIYFNTTIILSFIAGLGLGSIFLRKKADRLVNPFRFLGWLEIAIGFSSMFILLIFMFTAPWIHSIRMNAERWAELAMFEYGYYFLLLLLPAIFMGMTFPVVSVIYNRNMITIGEKMGVIGFLDTIGSVLGALLTGFFILPLLGVSSAFALIVVLNVIIGVWMLHNLEKSRYSNTMHTGLLIILLVMVVLFPGSKVFNSSNILYANEELVAYEEGISANVGIYREFDGQLALAINGAKTAFSNTQDLRVHKMLAYIPYAFTNESDTALVIGFGMGVTTNELLKLGFNHVEVAELSPEVAKLSLKYFGFLQDEFHSVNKPQLIIEDGRSYLVRSNKKYDIITSNAVHARLGINLYTEEFYRLCQRKLTSNGAVCQWLPTNWLEKDEFYGLVKAFRKVFPNAQLWYATRGHCILVGSKGNPPNLIGKVNQLYSNPETRSSLAQVEIHSPEQFMARLFVADKLSSLTEDVPVSTDYHPHVEFSYNIQKQPSIPVLETLTSHHTGYKKYIADSIFQHRTSIYNAYLRTELQQYIYQYR